MELKAKKLNHMEKSKANTLSSHIFTTRNCSVNDKFDIREGWNFIF